MILLSHPAVNAYTRNLALAFHEARVLDRFVTCLGWGEASVPSWLPTGVRNECLRRAVPGLPDSLLHRHSWREAGRLAASRVRLRGFVRHEKGFFSTDSVYQDLDRYTASHLPNWAPGLDSVYAGEDGAASTFAAARRMGLRCVYDLPIASHKELQRLIAEEKEALPEFASTLQGISDSPAKLARKDTEIELADLIVACSQFVADSLIKWGIPQSKIRVLPYGAPEGISPRQPSSLRDRPFRVLFAGAVTQRKGIGYFLQAARRLQRPDVEWIVMGSLGAGQEAFSPYRDSFRYEPPRPHAEVLTLMKSCDVLVLPSIVEGFALVVFEAMACGLPVIVTPNTGAGSWVRDQVDGFVIPIRSVDAIVQAVTVLSADRDRAAEMGRLAAQRAASRPWSRFRREALELLEYSTANGTSNGSLVAQG